MTTLIPVFADQLSHGLSSLSYAQKDSAHVLMMEVAAEADHVQHHRKKLVFLFSAMRHFAQELRQKGWTVTYVELTDEDNTNSFTSELERNIKAIKPSEILLTEPGEYRVLEMAKGWSERFGLPVEILQDSRFVASHQEFEDWARGRKQLRMEYFYRDMRKKTGLLMEGDEPAGGKWNFDSENRKPAKADLFMPEPKKQSSDEITSSVMKMVAERFPDRFGDIEPFWFAVNADQAKSVVAHFMKESLPSFGDYQDAMLTDEPFLYHSLISFYLNAGLLDPIEVCQLAEAEYKSGNAPINAVEGFVRQIIGWREYIRGIYWLNMPGYENSNGLDAKRALPEFYWSAETDMHCLSQAIGQTKKHAYAHHIQRLMITGNFALIAGIDPHQLHEWYLAVYADAFEWVEMPNTIGMSQFADGGLLASKPYAASAAYINRMSDYCKSCKYDWKSKTGENACPMNALYWHFIDRNSEVLSGNPRMTMMYANWKKQDPDQKQEVLKQAEAFLSELK